MTDWQPIETAPKDRHLLIAYCTKYGYRVDMACWAAWEISETHNWMTLDGALLPNDAYAYWMDIPKFPNDWHIDTGQ